MDIARPIFLEAPWIAVAAVWGVTSLSVKRPARSEAGRTRTEHLFTVFFAFALLFLPALRLGPFGWRLVPPSSAAAVIGLSLSAAGAAFSIWARAQLGGNWSATVSIKQEHTLIRRGPYAVVRHPIYTGFLCAMLGAAIAFGELGCFFAVFLGFAAWQAKARMEESFLLTQFGNAYAEYQQDVKMMIPLVL